jgi:hypothetical protein
LIAEHEPAKYDAAAVHWHARWELEGRCVGFAVSTLALAALRSIGGSRRDDALRFLRGLV